MTLDTGDGYPLQLVHLLNVLVFESLGGSANHVFVFTFHNGRPSLVVKGSTAGGVQVRQLSDGVSVIVPQKTYPGPNGEFPSVPDKVYQFPLEH